MRRFRRRDVLPHVHGVRTDEAKTDVRKHVPPKTNERFIELRGEGRDFDWMVRLLRIDNDRFAWLHIDQLVFDLLLRFQ
jgi:hypothetical protein